MIFSRKRLKTFFGYWLPLVVYMLLIFYLSSLPNGRFENMSDNLGIDDRLEHFVEYSVLAVLWFRLFKHHKKKNPHLMAVAFSALYGITDEIHQLFVPTRIFSFNDILFNFLGSLVSILILIFVFKIGSRWKK